MRPWFTAKLGQFRLSTAVLIVVFIALFWVQQTFQPAPAPQAPAPSVVPPGFVPDPNYTWVPRTNVRRPKEPVTTTTTAPTTTETPTPSETATSSTSPTSPTPTTTVVDPDGPLGPLGPQTLTQTPTVTAPSTAQPVPGVAPATPEAPR